MTVVWNVLHLVVVLSAVAWVILWLTGRLPGRVPADKREPLPDPYAFPPADQTRPADPGAPYGDCLPTLPVKPLPPDKP